jgi:hypothetical protein
VAELAQASVRAVFPAYYDDLQTASAAKRRDGTTDRSGGASMNERDEFINLHSPSRASSAPGAK